MRLGVFILPTPAATQCELGLLYGSKPIAPRVFVHAEMTCFIREVSREIATQVGFLRKVQLEVIVGRNRPHESTEREAAAIDLWTDELAVDESRCREVAIADLRFAEVAAFEHTRREDASAQVCCLEADIGERALHEPRALEQPLVEALVDEDRVVPGRGRKSPAMCALKIDGHQAYESRASLFGARLRIPRCGADRP